MKCKYCGQEIVVDEQTKVGVCAGCGRKFAISTVAKAKVCKACNADLVDKGAYWECPECGKKYSFSKKKDKGNEGVVPSNDSQQQGETHSDPSFHAENESIFSDDIFDVDVECSRESINQSETSRGDNTSDDLDDFDDEIKLPDDFFTEKDKKELNEKLLWGYGSDEKNVSGYNYGDEDTISVNNEPENDYIEPLKDNQMDEVIIPEVETSDSDTEIFDDELIDDIEEDGGENNENTNSETSNDVILNEPSDLDTISQSLTNSEDAQVYDNAQSVLVEPKLYDENGVVSNDNEYFSGGFVSSLQSMTNGKTKTKSATRGGSVVCKITGILLGILIALCGVACYAFSHFELFEKIAKVSIENLLPTLQKVSSCVFFGLLALTLLLATLKNVGLKRIGTIISLISPVLLILTILLGKKMSGENVTTYAVYAGYAILLFGSFLIMVISCNSELSKSATAMGIVLFVFSLLSLLTVALQMIPLKALKLSFLENYVQYFKDVDKVLLGFASISSAVLISKSE